MKAKLLKKIRKRFEIIYVESCDDPNHFYNKYEFELPCYVLFDNSDNDFWSDSKNYEYIYKVLRIKIRKEYSSKFNKYKVKSKKIWYYSEI